MHNHKRINEYDKVTHLIDVNYEMRDEQFGFFYTDQFRNIKRDKSIKAKNERKKNKHKTNTNE